MQYKNSKHTSDLMMRICALFNNCYFITCGYCRRTFKAINLMADLMYAYFDKLSNITRGKM